MSFLRYTLITDGSSDKALLNIIKWLLDDLYPKLPNKGEFADFGRQKNPPPKRDIASQIKRAQEFYPFDLLFYHRDAENNDKDIIINRKSEVYKGVGDENIVCIVPIVMMESWLLFDECAIKKAAGNRNYKGKIYLPPLQKIEKETKPKDLLHKILKETSGLKKRSLSKFNVHQAVHLVAENINDFSPLRNLSAFKIFEEDLKVAVEKFLKKTNK